jgi:hypothetical protein
MTPIRADPKADISTAPAARSLDFLTRGWKSGEETSARILKAVLRASAVQTAMMARTLHHHSARESPKYNAMAVAKKVAQARIHALRWDLSIVHRPRNARLKLPMRPLNWNGRFIPLVPHGQVNG